MRRNLMKLGNGPTLLYAAGIDIPDNWEGKPLQISDRDIDDPIFYILGDDQIAVRVNDWKYLESGDSEELYQASHSDVELEQVHNQEKHKKLQTAVETYRDRAESIGSSQSELADDTDLSSEVEEKLEDLGYL